MTVHQLQQDSLREIRREIKAGNEVNYCGVEIDYVNLRSKFVGLSTGEILYLCEYRWHYDTEKFFEDFTVKKPHTKVVLVKERLRIRHSYGEARE